MTHELALHGCAAAAAGAPAAPAPVSWVYTAWVDIGPRRALGAVAAGSTRFLVDILGGHFEGPGLRGRVLPGGADRQLLRPDGVRELDALYEMLRPTTAAC